MCGPTAGQKSAAIQAQNFSNQVTGQAGEIFGKDSEIFNNLMSSYQSIVKGGPNQEGFSEGELSNLRSNVITTEAQAYKNAKAAVGNAVSAIGGGNEVNPSGLEADVNTQTANAAAEATASGLQKVQAADYETGRENYFKAAGGEEQLGQVFNSSSEANKTAVDAQGQNMSAQNALSAANNWWEPIVGGAIGAAGSLFTGAGTQMLKKG